MFPIGSLWRCPTFTWQLVIACHIWCSILSAPPPFTINRRDIPKKEIESKCCISRVCDKINKCHLSFESTMSTRPSEIKSTRATPTNKCKESQILKLFFFQNKIGLILTMLREWQWDAVTPCASTRIRKNVEKSRMIGKQNEHSLHKKSDQCIT